ncbi:MAG TPA: YkgJ family cysteine cluster protein [Anaeromyxobacteraceae bacterium]|nr:YkgJ family cysteine cluster protein [Anaeromyxobacteraceae bacterium]
MPIRSPRIRRRGVLLDAPADSPARCADCDGVCCWSFPSIALSWPEYQRLQGLGARRLEFTLARPFLLIENGCEFLEGGRCAIYPHRPEVCRRFVCVGAAVEEEEGGEPALMPLA